MIGSGQDPKAKKTLTPPGSGLFTPPLTAAYRRRRETCHAGNCYGRRQRHARSCRPHARSGPAAFAGGALSGRTIRCGSTPASISRPLQIAYQTYGTLNAERTNAVLVCHALTGDQHVANDHPVTGKPGWWETMVGPGRPIDTDRYFVICANVLGGCMGSTGPASTNPATGMPWGLDFPVITIRDMVRAQAMLIDHLGIESLFAVVGGSMGGMQVLQWAASYPRARVRGAADRRRDAAFGAEHRLPRGRPAGDHGRSGLARRPLFRRRAPIRGAGSRWRAWRAHITYLSDAALHRKFGRRFQDRDNPTFSLRRRFSGRESICATRASTFVERFDANSYLYLTRAMDYFDLAADHDGVLAQAFRGTPTRFCVISFTSDWLFPTAESRAHRACAQRRRRARVVRRDRDRQGPRRVPARRAGIVRHRARLS